jgi:hypothetical protein
MAYHPMYNVIIGTLIYFIALARRDSGLESFQTTQNGIGVKSPINLDRVSLEVISTENADGIHTKPTLRKE